ncbi:cytochrome c oxidase subunit 5B, mitochondrial-like [Agrilus planipennis]|uniref:Cytochrome c oxidase subunit 5B, mitochondrial-like n=1 Tax=Agrilus planipennis TaxID=224129 RepID=A0A1W4XJ19_AGRPL|nr:cytochrome c oxidase subunit 5B, mitochondrial-like [Agrilus planipennis]
MASLCGRLVKFAGRQNALCGSKRLFAVKITMGDPIEHATGLEKRELLARIAGNEDPYASSIRKRGPGTKNQPNEVPSAFDSRIIGCVCEEDSTSINWMWVHKGHPKRCECGHWFNLVHRAPV